MDIKAKLTDKQGIERIITRISHEILERNKGAGNIVLIGIKTRGEFLAHRIFRRIKEIENTEPLIGFLDATLYRDDFRTRIKQPQVSVSNITFNINDKNVIIIDDVLYTGRTVRAALNALMEYGRPANIQLCVLVDRGHRELPIKADYIGKNIPTSLNESVKVKFQEIDDEDGIYLIDTKEES